MSKLFQKLNIGSHTKIAIYQHPKSFQAELDQLSNSIHVFIDQCDIQNTMFYLFFVTKQEEIDRFTTEVISKTEGDAVVWFAYPKQTSKNYRCDFNRDNGWDIIYQYGFRPVRMVAIDEDWSAFRIRRLQYVKTQ